MQALGLRPGPASRCIAPRRAVSAAAALLVSIVHQDFLSRRTLAVHNLRRLPMRFIVGVTVAPAEEAPQNTPRRGLLARAAASWQSASVPSRRYCWMGA